MLALREIRKADSDKITINIPEEFRGSELEVIILKSERDITNRESLADLFNYSLTVDNICKYNRDELHAR